MFETERTRHRHSRYYSKLLRAFQWLDSCFSLGRYILIKPQQQHALYSSQSSSLFGRQLRGYVTTCQPALGIPSPSTCPVRSRDATTRSQIAPNQDTSTEIVRFLVSALRGDVCTPLGHKSIRVLPAPLEFLLHLFALHAEHSSR